MTAFTVDLPQLLEIVDRMAEVERNLEAQAAELDARAVRVRGAWSGAAADAYADEHREWMRGARQMRESLACLHRVASTAHDNYAAASRANVSMWP